MNENYLNENINQVWCSIIIDQLCHNNIDNFYLAPGMRNAPLLRAASNHSKSKFESFLDERALAYRALGFSKNGKIPALICTSGTALANFLPAVIESYRSNQPIVVISADRPIDLVKTDANQTIDQTSVIKNFVCDSLNLDSPCESLTPKRLRTLIQNIINKAIRYKRPIHINVPLREPLNIEKVNISKDYDQLALESFERLNTPTNISYISKYNHNEAIEKIINSARSPLLVVGKIEQDIEIRDLTNLLSKIDIPKYIDVTSKVKYSFPLFKKMNPSFDHPEVYKAYNNKKPDLIIHIGGRVVSKNYYKFQDENPHIRVLHVTHFDNDHDPGFSNNTKIICSIKSFLEYLSSLELSADSPIDWNDFINSKRRVIEESELSFPFISKRVIENSLKGSHILIGNSTAIRSFDNYIDPIKEYEYKIFSNRGVSGIEGFQATLLGIYDANKDINKPFTLIAGDVTFMHDLNSLYMLNTLKKVNINIIVINDNGGGIFKLLPIVNDKDYIDCLTTPHNNSFEKLIAAFSNIYYTQASTKDDFINAYTTEQNKEHVSFIEVCIKEKTNLDVFQQLKTLKL